MTDQRAAKVLNYREDQAAQAVWILTVVTPFSVSQSRAIVVQTTNGAQLVTCSGCTPRTALGQGVMRDIAHDVLSDFLANIDFAEKAWAEDAIPSNVHDGITITVERATPQGYARVRIVDPQPNSPHERLIAAWANAYPEIRTIIR